MRPAGESHDFHPAVTAWFEQRFPTGPSEPQRRGWPAIGRGGDVLIAAPTGTGKTLSGFLVAIDALYRAHERGESLGTGTRIVYVSPLKALAVDIHHNLEGPLAEIAALAAGSGITHPELSIGVRTGDTSASDRTAMVKTPPDILVTTPESLYLLLTSERSRETLRRVETVIVDEIHALARDKRGAHLALSLERLATIQHGPRPQRIGLSATQNPIDGIARLLSGTGTGPDRTRPGGARRTAEIVDCGHLRDAHLSLVLPGSELEAVASDRQFGEILDAIADEVRSHHTTLVFVNTRRMAERVAHLLGERLDDDTVVAHHGSLSKERRKRVEDRLRAGELRALVATASLELGIDVGPVELVCQIGSPRSIATFLQRVGRSNHSLGGTPTGLLFPMTRDELVECAALLASLRQGQLDAVIPPVAPLDVLAQQIVAEVAALPSPAPGGDESSGAAFCGVASSDDEPGWSEDGLFALVRRAAPYAALARADFDDVIAMVSEGIVTGRGARGAYLHRDGINKVVRPRRGARLAALTNGGAIPETGDYRVVLEPTDTFLGTVNEDFAIESMIGDVFLLGTHSWQIRQVTQGTVRVVDAGGAHPTIPFWVGEAPARTAELSTAVSDLRESVDRLLGDGGGSVGRAARYLMETCGIGEDGAAQIVAYLAAARGALGSLPTQHRIVFERFFDETGGMQLVVHAPYGGRVNRGLGLALRKRLCATFDFELQAAADDDAVVLSLGPQHSFPLSDTAKLLRSSTVAEVLTQSVLTSPMFAARWRWNLTRALVVLRQRGGSRNPLPIQRMESDDVMAAIFPALAACQENAPAGPIPVPDHALVRQTVHDCLHEAMDVDALAGLLASVEEGTVETVFVDSPEPSVLSHGILNGRPYTFLDDAPLEERRTRAVTLRRDLPVEVGELGALEPAAIARVRAEVAPDPRSAEELHDLLLSLVVAHPVPAWQRWLEDLARAGRVARVHPRGASGEVLWCATEHEEVARAAFDDDDGACAEVVRGHLDFSGPITVGELAAATALAESRVRVGLAILEGEGSALRGTFDPAGAPPGDSETGAPGAGATVESATVESATVESVTGAEQWCARRLLLRIHAYSRTRRRSEIEPVSQRDFWRFLLEWHHLLPSQRRTGRRGLAATIDQLQGFEAPAGSWETEIFASRVEEYRPEWLDDLCLSGEVVWGRFGGSILKESAQERRGSATPSRATPITFALREDADWLLQTARWPGVAVSEPDRGPSKEILDLLRARGALFHADLSTALSRLPAEIEEGLWDLVARGIATADGFHAARSLLSSREIWQRRQRMVRRGGPSARAVARMRHARTGGEGRWALLPAAGAVEAGETDVYAESVAEQLLVRWGVVFYDLFRRERYTIPWREVLWGLRRMEARGQVRGGHFVTGISGEQYALPEAVDGLRRVRKLPDNGDGVVLGPKDPLHIAEAASGGLLPTQDRVST